MSLCPLIIHHRPETWTISESLFFIFYLSVGVSLLPKEISTCPGLNPKENLSTFSKSLPKENKIRIKSNFIFLGENPNGFKSIPQTPLAHQEILSFFLPTSQFYPLPTSRSPFSDFLEWKHNGCAEWTRVARRRHEENEVSQLLRSFRSFFGLSIPLERRG